MRLAAVVPLFILALALLEVCIASVSSSNEELELIGWLGEKPRHGKAKRGSKLDVIEPSAMPDHGMVVLSWEPRIFVYRSVLTPGKEHENCGGRARLKLGEAVEEATVELSSQSVL